MLEEEARLEAQLTQIKAPRIDARAKRAVALLACGRAVDGLDLADPGQRRLAVVTAYDMLEALGLIGDPDMWIPSPATAKSRTAPFLHGTEGGVKHHLGSGARLCKPCRRWQEVDARKHGGAIEFLRPRAGWLLGLCGTYHRWQVHLDLGESVDAACRMYADWYIATQHHRHYTGPLAGHTVDRPLKLHLDGSPCTSKTGGSTCVAGSACTGMAGYRLSCSCGHTQAVATLAGCLDMQQDHRRQVILRALAEAN